MIRSARSVSKPLACSDGPVRPNSTRHAATLAAAGASASAAIAARIRSGLIVSGSHAKRRHGAPHLLVARGTAAGATRIYRDLLAI